MTHRYNHPIFLGLGDNHMTSSDNCDKILYTKEKKTTPNDCHNFFFKKKSYHNSFKKKKEKDKK